MINGKVKNMELAKRINEAYALLKKKTTISGGRHLMKKYGVS